MAKKKQNQTDTLVKQIVEGIREKKGKDIVCLDMRELKNAVSDFFIVCHGDSDRQTKAIADSIEEFALKQAGEKPWHVEGTQTGSWILLDYVNVVAHVFTGEAREFYHLEKLWADAVRTEYETIY